MPLGISGSARGEGGYRGSRLQSQVHSPFVQHKLGAPGDSEVTKHHCCYRQDIRAQLLPE